ncbi:hypothetical protein CONCODRAFT_12448 [Conidiobolus coronatus NRRL 28638]|uniref:Uncharacterized protein n=1 Tax=Conidiobolus coronatus (strain ATCC 28846 / CBS 209.66 / NRRL 28638) TaxID=796925 RepID=A0A137NSY7_CONC2|nr:hypothetical protein CONCODRAFT_12448 [Conidiobolus coronatus NRRL 28638]|eukprot:KXN65846.1 hypothetical protein CONCODRAFT_12448 [Conidiobolus coronatus NRRL 28638]
MLDNREYKSYKVVITVKSLGGSLTTIHVVDIASMVKNKADIFSHLAPRSWGYVHIPVEFCTDFSDIASNSLHERSQNTTKILTMGGKRLIIFDQYLHLNMKWDLDIIFSAFVN